MAVGSIQDYVISHSLVIAFANMMPNINVSVMIYRLIRAELGSLLLLSVAIPWHLSNSSYSTLVLYFEVATLELMSTCVTVRAID